MQLFQPSERPIDSFWQTASVKFDELPNVHIENAKRLDESGLPGGGVGPKVDRAFA